MVTTAKQDGFELKIVEAKEAMKSPAWAASKRPTSPRRPAPSRDQALEAVRAAFNGESIIARIPTLAQVETWADVAYWSVCKTTGATAGGVSIWKCDIPGDVLMSEMAMNCHAYFAGSQEQLADGESPFEPDLQGQVSCSLNAPSAGNYLFL